MLILEALDNKKILHSLKKNLTLKRIIMKNVFPHHLWLALFVLAPSCLHAMEKNQATPAAAASSSAYKDLPSSYDEASASSDSQESDSLDSVDEAKKTMQQAAKFERVQKKAALKAELMARRQAAKKNAKDIKAFDKKYKASDDQSKHDLAERLRKKELKLKRKQLLEILGQEKMYLEALLKLKQKFAEQDAQAEAHWKTRAQAIAAQKAALGIKAKA